MSGLITYAYGVTTCSARIHTLLPMTLQSLGKAGFPKPRLFIDGEADVSKYSNDYEITQRVPNVRTAGNWTLSAYELYIRNPNAQRYAMFQDDFVTYPNLRAYLDRCEFPETGYWNLYTFPENERELGWSETKQTGRGAVALIFSNFGLRNLLSSEMYVQRPLEPYRGWRRVDGGIVDAMNERGWREHTHTPSLVQHTGLDSSMGNPRQELAHTFRGEDFDALQLVDEVTKARSIEHV